MPAHRSMYGLKKYIIKTVRGNQYVYRQIRLPDGTIKQIGVGPLDRIVDQYLLDNPGILRRINTHLTSGPGKAEVPGSNPGGGSISPFPMPLHGFFTVEGGTCCRRRSCRRCPAPVSVSRRHLSCRRSLGLQA